ncbi:MAG: hypothetical protein U0U46_12745 [Saprospiraceae bacterium]|nr:hypothetical protein [Saprospiraceae bacterium]HNL38255.1 hypothetical protein [Saprospiraceae bacterium]
MRSITIHDLRDSVRLSLALHETLVCLRASPMRLTASHICRLAQLDNADLSRMRRLHQCPQYRRMVNKFKIWRLLYYLLQEFPALEIREYANGRIAARLMYKKKERRAKKAAGKASSPATGKVKRR